MATILFVEDDFGYRQVFSDILVSQGYSVIGASSGKDALAQLAKATAIPDLCILDFHMGDMTGYDLIQEFRRRKLVRDVPILMLTATRKEIKTLIESEGVQYFDKSTSYQDILEKIRQMLGAAVDGTSEPSPAPASMPLQFKFQGVIVRCMQFVKMGHDPNLSRSLHLSDPKSSPIMELIQRILDEIVTQDIPHVFFKYQGSMIEMWWQSPAEAQPVLQFPEELQDSLVMHVVNLAHLNIVHMDRAQEGKFSWKTSSGSDVELHVSIAPSETGHMQLKLWRVL